MLTCIRKMKSAGTILVEKVKERDHMDELGVDGRTSRLVLRPLWYENADWIDCILQSVKENLTDVTSVLRQKLDTRARTPA